MEHHEQSEQVAAYALGALDEAESVAFEEHVAGCASCRQELAAHAATFAALAPADPLLREQLLDLAHAPALPIDPAQHTWVEPVPGVRLSLHREDAARSLEAYIVWADPGAQHPAHRHLGPELILVLQGGIRDERGEYLAGEICKSRTGSVHTEEVLPLGECFCYVLYYGGLEMLDAGTPD